MCDCTALQQTKGTVSAEVATDSFVEGDYSRLTFGLRSAYSTAQDGSGATSFEPLVRTERLHGVCLGLGSIPPVFER